jgi:hypothetical protein
LVLQWVAAKVLTCVFVVRRMSILAEVNVSDDPDELRYERAVKYRDPAYQTELLEELERHLHWDVIPMLRFVGWTVVVLLALILWRVWD